MSRIARKRFFGVHGPDSPAWVHVHVHDVDTETKNSLLSFNGESFEIFQSLQEGFQSVKQRKIGSDPPVKLPILSAPFGIYIMQK